ncbi:MAG: copper amine oxidase N-terminal domain-containing protein [Oscillospiraceae bacterium]|jgi:hypothetical protein|nr:copper amine oxidase N-terminal domain-containing protein [Oscillospiraceae bacterium]
MSKFLKRSLLFALSLSLLLAVMSVGALAAPDEEDPFATAVTTDTDAPISAPADGIGDADTDAVTPSIQLNGQLLADIELVFDLTTDRNYIQFLDLFTALGAEVSYNEETKVVTAVRGDRTISFEQFGTEITIAVGGETYTITSDVVPLTISDHVFVPVRFPAQALGAKVGWDEAAQTVIIIDPYLLDLSATYTIFDSTADLYTPAGNTALTATLTASLDDGLGGKTPVTATLDAVASDAAIDASFTFSTEISAPSPVGDDATQIARPINISGDVILNPESGLLAVSSEYANTLYANLFGAIAPDAWLTSDLETLLTTVLTTFGLTPESLADFAAIPEIAEVPEITGAADLINYLLIAVEPTSVDEYAVLDAYITVFQDLYADDAFELDGTSYVSTYELPEDSGTLIITIETDEDGNAVSVTFAVVAEAEGASIVLSFVINAESLTLSAVLDAADQIFATLELTVAPTDAEPRTELPEGASTGDLNALLELVANLLIHGQITPDYGTPIATVDFPADAA